MKRAFTILIFLWAITAFSQSKEDLQQTTSLFSPAPPVTYHVHFEDENELVKLTKGLFWVYKKYVSSQDMQSCNFEPSCSVYAMQAVSSKGFFKGVLMTFDRLTRCQPLGGRYYDIHQETGLWYDPVN